MKTLCILLVLSALPLVLLAEDPDRIIFPHDLHFENDVECATCHAAAASSLTASDRLLPDMDICADCHDIDDDEQCSLCHTNVELAGEYEIAVFGAERFAHAPHLVEDQSCAGCHGEPAATHPQLPGKPDCRACHETADDYADCRLCHGADYALVPDSHGPSWQNGHGLLARADEGACYQCHTENTCQECHNGDNVRPRSHRLNYTYDHALDARGNEMLCATCHQEATYCSNCHIAERVLPQNHSQAGWVTSNGGGRHATEGVFELESCIACHDTGATEPSCARCHTGD